MILALPLTAKKDDQKDSAEDSATRQGPEQKPASSWPPSPWAMAMAVLGMLALGVLIGSVTDQVAQNAGFPTVLLGSSAPPPEEEATPETASAEPAESEAAGGGSAAAATPSTIPAETPLVEEPLPEAPKKPEVPLVEEELPTGLPEVKHVFVIMLQRGGYEEAFGKASTVELPRQRAAETG